MTLAGWWSAFRNAPWRGGWALYPGVWLFLAGLVVAYRAVSGSVRRAGHAGPTPRDRSWFVLGLISLWIALDGPLAALGASHLASVRMLQYLLVGIVAPALLILGLPTGAFRLLAGRHDILRFLRPITHPIVALLVFNAGMTVTLWPSVANTLMVSPLGSLAIHGTWLACGLVLWWPVIAPVPARPSFHPLLRVAYLGANVVFVMPPAAMMFFSQSPVYALHSTVSLRGGGAVGAMGPPGGSASRAVEAIRMAAVQDQQRAGAVVKVGSAWIFAVAMFVVAFRWYRTIREESHDPGLEVKPEG